MAYKVLVTEKASEDLDGIVGYLALELANPQAALLLPDEIDARPKTGFGVPLDVWFRGELNGMLKEALFDASSERSSNWFDRDYVSRLVREHEEGRFDHAARLWSLFVFRLWEARP